MRQLDYKLEDLQLKLEEEFEDYILDIDIELPSWGENNPITLNFITIHHNSFQLKVDYFEAVYADTWDWNNIHQDIRLALINKLEFCLD